MKIACSVSVGNRLLPSLALNPKRKYAKSTLALCRKPKTNDFSIILFSSNNKNGTKYEIKKNISGVLTKFLNEGKATIQFIQPQHDLYIQGDKIQLKGFLHLLHRAMTNKLTEKEMTCSSLAVTPISNKNLAPTKMVIKSRGDYPIRGFPRTLEVLTISEINRCTMDKGILQLKRLRVLDLSHNLLEELPEDFSGMPCLCELNLSHNNFGKSHPKTWAWMSGPVSKNLKLLNVSHNNMRFLPDQLVKLHNLITLIVDNNELTVLPSGIGSLRFLQVFSASNNRLSSLPGSVKIWRLLSLDLCNNNFDPNQQSNPAAIFPKPLPVCTLKEYAAKKLLHSKIIFSSGDLPATVIKFLDFAKYCVCGKACFEVFIRHAHMLSLSSISQSMRVDVVDLYVPMDCYFCSLKCFGSANYNRSRNPVI